MLLGLWKNITDLEESICLNELEALLTAAHDREYRQNKFTAALKGVNLDSAGEDSAKEKFEEVKRRVEARTSGKSESEIEFDAFSLDVETG